MARLDVPSCIGFGIQGRRRSQRLAGRGVLMVAMILAGVCSLAGQALADTLRRDHVTVEYTGIDRSYAEAMATLLETACDIYRREFAADLPDRVTLSVTCGDDQDLRLWNDGQDRITLTLKSAAELRKPADSGVFNVYGLCHELGHIVMYRPLKERSWLSDAAAEGWAHYCGSYVVDGVFAKHGESLWPDRYDFSADGLKRLDEQLKAKKPNAINKAAGEWRILADLIGRKSFHKLFEAWNKADIDGSSPEKGLKAAVASIAPPESQPKIDKWYRDFSKACVTKVERSAVSARTIGREDLAGAPQELKYDDDGTDAKRSIAGGAHAVRFDAPAGEWYITTVKLYGSRYGRPQAPNEDVKIMLCDDQLKPIKTWKKPYSTFSYGDEKWHAIELPPTRVPSKFAVCFEFNPTGTKGVYVHMDRSTSGHSTTSPPGRKPDPLEGGDWMIRVELDKQRAANPLMD